MGESLFIRGSVDGLSVQVRKRHQVGCRGEFKPLFWWLWDCTYCIHARVFVCSVTIFPWPGWQGGIALVEVAHLRYCYS